MRKTILNIFFLLLAWASYGQNMVLNPSFEQYVQCPTSFSNTLSQFVSQWNQGPNWNSPHYYNSCATFSSGVWVPQSYGSYQYPLHGQAYTSIRCYSANSLRTNLWGNLVPLTQGMFYKVQIHVCLSEASQQASEVGGVFFYQNGAPATNYGPYYLGFTPQVDYSGYGIINDTANWTTLTDTLYADSAYSHLVIGNFKHNNFTAVSYTGFGQYYNSYSIGGSQYLIDSVIVEPITVTLPPLTATVTGTDNLCSGGSNGSATATPSGGWPPYSYLWSDGQTTQTATGLTAGTYTCTVTDITNASVSQTITITEPPTFSAVLLSSTPATCGLQNGAATIVASGGTPGYFYQWLPYGGSSATAVNLGAGTYTVNIADTNFCPASLVVTINNGAAFSLSTTLTNVSCHGGSNGSATVTPSGGTQPFTYLWSNGQTTQTATNLGAGTYTVTVTDANGCTETANVTIAQPPQLGGTVSIVSGMGCYNFGTWVCNFGPYGGTPPYAILWSNGQYGVTATGNTAGTYSVTVTDANGCQFTTSVNITQPPQLNLNISSVTNTSCAQSNGSATVTASGGTPGYLYSWAPTGGNAATATGLGAGVYTVTVTDANNCTDTVHVSINTSTLLNVFFPTSANVSCYGLSNGSATVSASGGTTPYSYLWGNSSTSATISGVPAGIYSVTVTDANGCAGTAAINITQPLQLNAVISSASYPACNGQNSGTATVQVTGGTPQYSYLWSNGQTTATATGLAAGTYTVTVTDANNCSDTAQVSIQQPPVLSVSISSSADATCSQNNGWATATASGGTGPYIYNWSNSQSGATAANLGAGTYTVTVTDANGCSATATVAISQSAALSLAVGSDDVSCFGLGDGTASVAVSTGTQPYAYLWSTGATTAAINGLAPGTYTVTVTDAVSCQGTATVLITEPAVLDATLVSSAGALCYGQSNGNAEVTVSGGTLPYSYLWSNGGSTALQNALAAGSYTVIVTDSNGCTDSASVLISEPAALAVSATAGAGACAGQPQGTATSVASGGTPPYSYSWNSNPPQSGAAASNLLPGSYTVTVTDSNGCSASATVAVAAYPLPVVDAGADVVYCEGKDSLQLQATGAASYSWSPGTGLSCTGCPAPVAAPSSTITYTVSGTDTNGCTATDEVKVTVLLHQPVAVGTDEHICTGESVQLFAEGGGQYLWSPAEGLSEVSIAEPVAAPLQTTEYSVVIRQNDCFSDTLSQLVTVHTMPAVSLGPDIKAVTGSSITLHADTANATTLSWTPAFNLSCDDCTDPLAYIEKDIRYVVTVSNEGCTAVDDISIKISCSESDVFLANSFTPNEDGNNDFFFPQTAAPLKIAYMAVYARWGERIFEQENFFSNDPKTGWNGKYKGKDLEPNTFVYYLQFYCGDGQKILLKGDVSIVK